MNSVLDRMAKLWRENWLFLVALGAIGAALLGLRTQASTVGTPADLEAYLRRGEPTFIEFYSNT